MINALYQLTQKGLLKALSFLLASTLFALILMHSASFAAHFGGKIPLGALAAFYGMAILWIHGIGFEIKGKIWQLVFLPILGYLIVIGIMSYLLTHL